MNNNLNIYWVVIVIVFVIIFLLHYNKLHAINVVVNVFLVVIIYTISKQLTIAAHQTFLPTVLTVALMLQCYVCRRLVVCRL